MKKIISILLLCALLLSCFAGCTFGAQTPEPTEATQTPEFIGENISFSADPFIQSPELSWEYSLDIRNEDDGIYINDVLYKIISPTAAIVISYSDGFLNYAAFLDETNGNQEIYDVLMKIKNSKCQFLLETDADSKAGKRILVYKIDNSYYFVRLFDNGEIMRIHRAVIEQEV